MTSFYTIKGIVANPQPGTIIAYLGTMPPDGWMLCDGQQFVNASFPNLANALGSTTANTLLPNLSGLFLRATGTSTINSNYVGPPIRETQFDSIKRHYHNFTYDAATPSGSGGTRYTLETGVENGIQTAGGTETRPYCYGVNWIIKTDLNPSVPGQPIIISFTGTPATGVSVSFTAPAFNNSAVTNYAYSTNGGLSWVTRSPVSTVSPINIPSGSYTSVRLRAINSNGAGQASSVVQVA